MKKLRVLLLTYGKLPVPAVKGGAIETLLDSLIEENEKKQRLELVVISSEHPAIIPFNQTHEHTQVIPVKTKERPFRWFFQKCGGKLAALLTGKKKNLIPYPELISAAERYLKEHSVDCCIDLNCPERIPYLRQFFSGCLAVYLHNDYLNPRTANSQQLLQQLDGVLSVCDFLNDQVKKIARFKDRPALYRVNNGIQLADYGPIDPTERAKIRADLQIDAEECVIVFSGRITKTKGLHLLFDALSQLDSLEKVKVFVLGGMTYSSTQKDAYFNQVIAQAEKLPIEVVFTGYVEKAKIPYYLKAADICAVPSIFHETCCLSAVEAQAMGIPVIATKIGGIPEYISSKSAMLIDYDQRHVEHFAKGLDRLIHDQQFRKQLSQEALIRRERHSQARYYQEFVCSIENLTARKEQPIVVEGE
ncbi:glycosyltransferase family 4 protein [Enterococcus sp. AZ109]|uniref:glycosyltransferase family 4 protein n=1 Tax=Enterococcus sp. AZ109 TaxID=2774634 RepID=UPI003F29A3B6